MLSTQDISVTYGGINPLKAKQILVETFIELGIDILQDSKYRVTTLSGVWDFAPEKGIHLFNRGITVLYSSGLDIYSLQAFVAYNYKLEQAGVVLRNDYLPVEVSLSGLSSALIRKTKRKSLSDIQILQECAGSLVFILEQATCDIHDIFTFIFNVDEFCISNKLYA